MIAITCRRLCREPFLDRIEALADAGPEMIVLREKDLPHDAYSALLSDVWHICREHGVPVSANTDAAAAREVGNGRVHLPLEVLRREDVSGFELVGASVHSPEEAAEAESLGADYLIAGHVFPTACKLGKQPRGTGFVEAVCSAVSVPVYAVGGITPENCGSVYSAGAAGVCVMSSAMETGDPAGLVSSLTRPRPF